MDLVLDGFGFGECPRWHQNRLWFSDFILNRVVSVGEDRIPRVELELDDRPSGLGWLPDGRLLVVSMRRRAVLCREPDTQVSLHADLSSVAPCDTNDMVVSANGTAYVGNFGSDLLAGEPLRLTPIAIVFPDGSMATTADQLAFPNGSVITADGKTLIVGESLARRYRAFDIYPDGSLGPGRVWAELGARSPDGCALDSQGAIWFANPAGREVVRVREGGEILDVTPTPETAYACMLGGEDGQTLFVLTSPSPPIEGLGVGSGRLWQTRVEHAHSGRP